MEQVRNVNDSAEKIKQGLVEAAKELLEIEPEEGEVPSISLQSHRFGVEIVGEPGDTPHFVDCLGQMDSRFLVDVLSAKTLNQFLDILYHWFSWFDLRGLRLFPYATGRFTNLRLKCILTLRRWRNGA